MRICHLDVTSVAPSRRIRRGRARCKCNGAHTSWLSARFELVSVVNGDDMAHTAQDTVLTDRFTLGGILRSLYVALG